MKASLAFLLAIGMSPAAAQAPATPAPPANDRDPEAMAALNKMGAALRSLSSFELRTENSSEEVLASGQKLQFGGTVNMKFRRPDGLRVSIQTSRRDREIYYNGKDLTVFSPSLGYYAKFKAPPTLAETLKLAAEKYGLEIPLSDLASWGNDSDVLARVQTAFRVGEDMVNSKTCTHYAVRQQAVDWQVWLDQSGSNLPCKLVITSRQDPTMPQYSAVYTWRPGAKVMEGAFNFVPPKGASEIAIATMQNDVAAKGDK